MIVSLSFYNKNGRYFPRNYKYIPSNCCQSAYLIFLIIDQLQRVAV